MWALAGIAVAAPSLIYQRSILPVDTTENIGTTTAPWDEGHFNRICLTADCRTAWPTGGGSSFGQSWEINAQGNLAPTTTIPVLLPANLYASSTLWNLDTSLFSLNNRATTTISQSLASWNIATSSSSMYPIFSVNGTNGHIGVGTFNDDPDDVFIVGNNSNLLESIKIRNSSNASGAAAVLKTENDLGSTATIALSSSNYTGIGNANNSGILQTTGRRFLIDTQDSSGDISFYIGAISTSTMKVIIDSNGFLGIGTTTPSTFLSVHGNALVSGTTTAGNLFATSSLRITPLTSALTLTDSTGLFAEYAGTSCTNQFVRALDALGVSTCATVSASDVSLANLTATDGTLTFSGTYNGATARTIGLNLASSNLWTASTTFVGGLGAINATTTNATTTTLFVSGSATTTITGGTKTNLLNVVSTTASSTFANGINLTKGCYAVNDTCISAGGGSGTVGSGTTGQFPYYAGNGTTLTATSSLFLNTNNSIGVATTSSSAGLVIGTTLAYSVASTSATTTLTVNSATSTTVMLVNASSNWVGINLPTAVGLFGRVYKFIKTDSTSNRVTIDPAGSETINGQSTLDMEGPGDAQEIISDNKNWFIMP